MLANADAALSLGAAAATKMPGLAKPIWDMTPAEILQAMSGRGVASAKPAVEDLSTPRKNRSSSSSDNGGGGLEALDERLAPMQLAGGEEAARLNIEAFASHSSTLAKLRPRIA